jgi:exopolysaccharide production protein ExoQ
MSLVVQTRADGPTIRWRTIEWWGAGIALFLQTGAVIPLLMLGPQGDLDDSARAKLRLLTLPIYLIAILLLSRHPRQLLIALRRNLQLLLLLTIPFLSVVWSLSPAISLRRAVGLLGSVLLSYLLAIRFTPRQILILLAIVLGPCMVLSLVMMGAAPRLAFMPMESDVRGVFVHKNVLGWAAALSSLVSGMLAIDRSIGFRRTGLFLLIASLACLAVSKSMTGMLTTISAFFFTGFFLLLTRARGLSRMVFALVFVQAVGLFLISLSEFLVPALEALGKDATLTGRVPLWALVDERISHHLLFGYGYQAFWTPGNLEAWEIWEVIGWMAPHSHNGFREIMLNLGLVGLLSLALVMVRALRQGAVLQCSAPEDGWLWLNVLVCMFLVMNLTESMFLAQNDLFWILFTTAIVAFSLRHPEIRR